MTSTLLAGVNSYGTLAEADSYLGDSARAASWALLSVADKSKFLISAVRQIERQCIQGTITGVQIARTAAIVSGGSGHAVNDLLTVGGGTFGEAAVIKVLAVNSGAITSAQLVDTGAYSVVPSNPVSTTSSGSGTGATFTLTFSAQLLQVPRTGLTDQYGNAVDSTYITRPFLEAQFELAYELSLDPSLETSGGQGSNISSLAAGSARISYFRPTGGANGAGSPRFPVPVMELIGKFFCGANVGIAPAYAYGTGEASQFTDDARFNLSEGY